MNINIKKNANYVHSAGPESDIDRFGDEHPVWYVTIYDVDENELDSWSFHSAEIASDMGDHIADKHNVEHVDEACYA